MEIRTTNNSYLGSESHDINDAMDAIVCALILEGLAADANQELTYIRDYIEENVKEIWHRGDEFKGIKYLRINKPVIGNMEDKRFAVGSILEVEDGCIDILDENGGIEMVLRKEDTWAYIDDFKENVKEK